MSAKTRVEEQVLDALRKRSTLLFLGGMELTTLPDVVLWLPHLRELRLEGNQISVLPDFIGQMTELEELNLGDNRLTALPPVLGSLPRLKHLRLSRNRITVLPDEIGSLKQLESLRLHDNLLTELPSTIGELTSLMELRLSGNRLERIPETIAQMSRLQTLDLSRNKLTSLPETIGRLERLVWLYLDENQLRTLPKGLRELPRLEFLFLHGNSDLGLPPEILGKTWELVSGHSTNNVLAADILDYYFQSAGRARPLNEVKLLLVGRGTAGKSSLCERLLHGTYTPIKPETPGIAIEDWPLNCGKDKFHVHVWDFAGQEITHATHQFFLTERSVYVLVLNARADTQDRDAEYWLQLIDGFGKDSPIIVVLNQWDAKPFSVDEHALRDRYPAIRAFLRTDCKSGRGIPELLDELRALLAGWKEVSEPFPLAWWGVKERLTHSKDSYMSFEEYRRICRENGVTSLDDQARLARILHALGVILYYADDARLRDTTVLNPQWVTAGVYALLRLKERPGANGTLTLDEAAAALPGEAVPMVLYLLGLMQRFELCYPLDDGGTSWLVPQLLDRFQPALGAEWSAANVTRLRYAYKALPEGLVPRFIVRTHPLSDGGVRWRNGVVLRLPGDADHGTKEAAALVRAEPVENRVSVVAVGDPAARLRLVKLVRSHFAVMHADLLGLNPREELEVEGHPGIFKDVHVLERDEKKRAVTTVDTENGSVQIDATKELNRASEPAARDPERPRAKLFVSYAHSDARLLDVFKNNLEVMKMDGLVSWWFDGHIRRSSEWDMDIRRELEEADIIVLMVSQAFLSRPYIRGVELGRALQRKATGAAEIFVLVLEPECAWKQKRHVKQRITDPVTGAEREEEVEVELGKFQSLLPKNPKATRWPHHSAAFNHVDDALRRIIATVLETRRSRQAMG